MKKQPGHCAPAFSCLLLRFDLASFFGGKIVFLSANTEEGGLSFGGFPHLTRFLQLVYDSAFGPVLFDLTLALGFITSLLLACLFFLAFGKS
jgi:hypothetical protein